MKILLRQAKTVPDQRRIQAVLMRALHGLPPTRIAELTGLSVHTIRIIHSLYLRHGETALTGRPGRGGRRLPILNGVARTILPKRAMVA